MGPVYTVETLRKRVRVGGGGREGQRADKKEKAETDTTPTQRNRAITQLNNAIRRNHIPVDADACAPIVLASALAEAVTKIVP